jgi:hypothetical protein
MTKRYYQSTIVVPHSGAKITIFRATATMRYQSAGFGRYGDFGFSTKAPAGGMWSAIEITKAEYDALVACKAERLKAEGRSYTKPSDSWVEAA